MTDHSAPPADPFAAADRLRDLADPYATGSEVDGLFAAAMAELDAWHANASPLYSSLRRDSPIGSAADPAAAVAAGLTALPFVPATFFKTHEVLSVPREDVVVHVTSSGTSGRRSQMFIDARTRDYGARMGEAIFRYNGWIEPDQPVDYLVYVYEPSARLRLGNSTTGTALQAFAPTREATWGLRHTGSAGPNSHEFDVHGCIRALRRAAADGVPVRILGFPAFLSFTLDRMRALGIPPLELSPRSLVLLGGGWKSHADRQIPKTELYQRITDQLGIPDERLRDGFGSVEHSVPYFECRSHRFHLPVWSRLLVRSLDTLAPVPDGEPGFGQFISPYITSVPAHSVLLGDLISRQPGTECDCELPTPWFTVHGRAGVSRNKSCAIAAAELLKGAA